ncbi:hypothetical protein IJT93_07400 [bacterium]|nr:hypothetical protein [bacterium]
MFKKHCLSGLLFGLAFQIAFGMAFCGFVYYCLSEDEDALKFFPIVFALLWIFWLPFIIRNCYVYIRDWRAEKAGRNLVNRIIPGSLPPNPFSSGPKSEAEQLEEERRQRERENREWQERVTREQRAQNQKLNEKQDRLAEKYRNNKAEQERIRREQEDKLYKMAKKYWTEADPKAVRKDFDRRQQNEEDIGKAYNRSANIINGAGIFLEYIDKGAEASVNVAAEKEKCPIGPMHLIKNIRDYVKPGLVDPMDSLSRGDFWGALKGVYITGPAKGLMTVVQNYNPVGGLNVTIEAIKAKADCWRLGLEGQEAKDFIERKVAARKAYENTGFVIKTVTGDETTANMTKEIVSNLYLNDAAEREVAKQQAQRKSRSPKPSKYIQQLQKKFKDFKKTQKKIDLR